jgi:hypothetical protein
MKDAATLARTLALGKFYDRSGPLECVPAHTAAYADNTIAKCRWKLCSSCSAM